MNSNNLLDEMQSILFEYVVSKEFVVLMLDFLYRLIHQIENKYRALLYDLNNKEV